MPAMVARSKVADSRRPRSVGVPGTEVSSPWWDDWSVRRRVAGGEVVEPAGRAEAAELGGVVVEPRYGEQLRQLGAVLVAQRLLHAVGPERRHAATDVETGLVDRVAEGLAGVTADDQSPGLRHEGAHRTDVTADDDVDALHRDPASHRRAALDHEQPAVTGGACGLRGVAVDPDGAGHHVLRDAHADAAMDGDGRAVVHAR